MGGEVEIVHWVLIQFSIDELSLELVDFLEKHLLGVVEEVNVAVHLFIQLRDDIVVHLHRLFHFR